MAHCLIHIKLIQIVSFLFPSYHLPIFRVHQPIDRNMIPYRYLLRPGGILYSDRAFYQSLENRHPRRHWGLDFRAISSARTKAEAFLAIFKLSQNCFGRLYVHLISRPIGSEPQRAFAIIIWRAALRDAGVRTGSADDAFSFDLVVKYYHLFIPKAVRSHNSVAKFPANK